MFFTILLLTVVYIIIVLLEVPRLVVQKKWRDLIAFSILLFPAVIYSYGITLDLNLPNPTDLITFIFDPIVKSLGQVMSPQQ